MIFSLYFHLNYLTLLQRLNVDICNLSTLCTQKQCSNQINTDDLSNVLKMWKDQTIIPEPEKLSSIATMCQEVVL